MTFTASDHALEPPVRVAQVTVVDTLPPSWCVRRRRSWNAPGPRALLATIRSWRRSSRAASAADVCDAAPSLSNDAPPTIPLGTSPITSRPATPRATRARARRPFVWPTPAAANRAVAERRPLWPPNHGLVPVTATVHVADRCDPSVRFRSCRSPATSLNRAGDGDPPTTFRCGHRNSRPSFQLRAERSERERGALPIVYRATDAPATRARRAPWSPCTGKSARPAQTTCRRRGGTHRLRGRVRQAGRRCADVEGVGRVK